MNFAIGRWPGLAMAAITASVLALSGTALAGEVRFDGEGHAFNPVWSPDGKWVAFEVNRYAGNIDLFVSEVKGGGIAEKAMQVKLPGGSSPFGGANQVVVNPVWHPQGIMVFEGSNESGKFRLYYSQPGGAAAAEMLPKGKAPGDLTFPTVSSDGNLLGFISDETGNGDIRTWDRNTDKMNQVTSTPGSEMFPQFSTDGTKLLFSRKKNDVEALFIQDLSTGSETTVAQGQGDRTRPSFTKDGRVVYFSGERGDDQWDILVSKADGSGRKVLAKGVRLPLRARPALSPDGKWVAFAYDDPSKADSVWLVSLDGGPTVEVPTGFKGCGEPSLVQSNGRTILAYTALPSSEADWRFLYVEDVTDKL